MNRLWQLVQAEGPAPDGPENVWTPDGYAPPVPPRPPGSAAPTYSGPIPRLGLGLGGTQWRLDNGSPYQPAPPAAPELYHPEMPHFQPSPYAYAGPDGQPDRAYAAPLPEWEALPWVMQAYRRQLAEERAASRLVDGTPDHPAVIEGLSREENIPLPGQGRTGGVWDKLRAWELETFGRTLDDLK